MQKDLATELVDAEADAVRQLVTRKTATTNQIAKAFCVDLIVLHKYCKAYPPTGFLSNSLPDFRKVPKNSDQLTCDGRKAVVIVRSDRNIGRMLFMLVSMMDPEYLHLRLRSAPSEQKSLHEAKAEE
ncbi:hypothetical protein FKW77_003382 [Venturia effusa]|uniref:Uncharacterized protein n=1 Tax=Venturia effusa TaxID=50376 RepID=A0A517L116_9PEZI|nr:hypothetical protein FKW77_003382 [Venturia effusa]